MSEAREQGGEQCGTGCHCGGGMPRRTFLTVAGLGFLAVPFAGTRGVMAGPFTAEDLAKGHLIPAAKKLGEAWVKALFERGAKEVYQGEGLMNIGMPCGGIGAGQLYLRGDGVLGSWQIFNNPASNWVEGTSSTYKHRGMARPLEQGFAVHVRAGEKARTLPLSKDGFSKVRFRGEYPIGRVTYEGGGDLPVTVELEAFSPFIPLNARDSGLPATIFNITLAHAKESSLPELRVSVLGWLENYVCGSSGSSLEGARETQFSTEYGWSLMLHGAKPADTPSAPKVFMDFEHGYGAWEVTGTAFGKAPAPGTLPGQQPVSGFEGNALANSFNGNDDSVGRLTSPVFRVEHDFINFLIGGGSRKEQVRMELIVDGKTARSTAGRDTELLAWTSWYVREFRGKEARIIIVDEARDGWGHINVDQIEFDNRPRTDLPPAILLARDWGTLALACNEAGPVDGVVPQGNAGDYLTEGSSGYGLTEKRTGLLRTAEACLKPGEQHTFTFVLAWHFPNGERGQGQYYASRFDDAQTVARYLIGHGASLAEQTRCWRDTFYDSTLPYWLLDRLHSTASYLATGTSQWWKNGRFWAYEGVACCEGTCTHVWNYAHAYARLFPEVARSIRELQDFSSRENGGGFHTDTGLVGFRSNDDYAADGQCGTILKAYREYLMSPDSAFLERLWPRIKKALEYLIAQDNNADGILENAQPNTYDITYFGANTFVGSLYLAALRAGEEMARDMGDIVFARHVRAVFESGERLTLERLWDGEYFTQEVDLKEHPQHQYAQGCLSDQLFGQGWAHQVGLGYIYPREEVQTALRSIWKYNWAPDIGPYNEKYAPFRWFISPGQAGLLTCTWPKTAYLKEGTMYREEVWTGIEYQVAGHMIWEGMVTEGLAICRAIHDRYQPDLFNPYNEIECGDHYARAMASWGVYLALMGFEYHGPKGRLGFAPKISPEKFRAAFTAAEGWGAFSQTRDEHHQTGQITLRWGQLRLWELSFVLPEGRASGRVRVERAGAHVHAEAAQHGRHVRIVFEDELCLREGETLEIHIKLHKPA